MGTFLDMAACLGKSRQDVADALMQYAVNNDGVWQDVLVDSDKYKNAEEYYNDFKDESCLLETVEPYTLIMYPDMMCLGEDASQYLSEKLDCVVFSLEIYDGDFWMFHLYHQGKIVTRFNQKPTYFGEIDDDELESWRPDIEAICRLVPGVDPKRIERYLIFLECDEERVSCENCSFETKAYPDDEFSYCDEWQISDFMKALGIEYFYSRYTSQVFRFIMERH